MNPQDPLAALQPLRDPTPIGWWPLAPGWWMLAVLLVLALVALGVFLWRRHRANAYRRAARQQLEAIELAFRRDGDTIAFLSATNGLLKATALQAFPEQAVAASHGSHWIAFLNDSLTGAGPAFPESFALAAYAPGTPDIDCDELYRTSLNWINRHRGQS